LFEESLPAFLGAKIIHPTVQFFCEGVFLGKIGVAHFIFDHDSGKFTGRAISLSLSLGWKKKAKDKVDEIADKSVKDEPEKTGDHSLNVVHSARSVKPTMMGAGGSPGALTGKRRGPFGEETRLRAERARVSSSGGESEVRNRAPFGSRGQKRRGFEPNGPSLDGGNRRDWFPGVRGPRAAPGAHQNHTNAHVYTKLLILDFPKSKMRKDCFQRRSHGFSIH